MGIAYSIDPKIVRGLDYYTKTVFEFITTDIGAQGTICGGGRYDGLIEQMGGKSTPAMGFAMGLERLILTMERQGCEFKEKKTCDLYIAPMDKEAIPFALQLGKTLREDGLQVEYDLMGRGLKAQMKYANKIGASFVLVLGENELTTKKANLKNMETGEQTEVSLDDTFADTFGDLVINNLFGDIVDEFEKERGL
jgi:histidyl-tRNA synthetase